MIELLIIFVFAGFNIGFVCTMAIKLFAGDNIFISVLWSLIVGVGVAGFIALCNAALFGFDYLF